MRTHWNLGAALAKDAADRNQAEVNCCRAAMQSVVLILFTGFLVAQRIDADVQKQKTKAALLREMYAVCIDPKDVCKFEPCQNGGTCSLTDDKNQPYQCDCVFVYGGVNCERKLGK